MVMVWVWHYHEWSISPGLIVSDFLSCGIEPQQYCRSLLEEGGVYNGFSSIVADLKYVQRYAGHS